MKKLLFVCALGAFVACKNGENKEGKTDSAANVTAPSADSITTTPTDPKMDSAKMMNDDKMKSDKMEDSKMEGDKMKDDKMSDDKMKKDDKMMNEKK